MTRLKPVCIVFLVCAFSIGAGFLRQDDAPKTVVRAKRPTFKKKDWEGTWFEDIFKQGLVGQRPTNFGQMANDSRNSVSPTSSDSNDPASSGNGGNGWSEVIASSVIEDEIKRIQISLNEQVTTPVRFASGYKESRESFSMLSMLFQIIREYDSDIRWKEDADYAQAAFWRAAAASRVGSQQAYQNAKRRKDELTELVRGSSFPQDEKPTPDADWSSVVDRVQLMIRLQKSIDLLKPAVANKSEMNNALETIHHEANMVAAIGKALIQDGMEDGDEESYMEPSTMMTKAARDIVSATKSKDFDLASKSVNLIEQSCSNCHDEWR